MASSSDVLLMLIPNGGYVQRGEDYEGIDFLECEPITKKQYLDGFEKADKAKAKAEADKAAAKVSAQTKLAALGLTEDEVKAIIGN